MRSAAAQGDRQPESVRTTRDTIGTDDRSTRRAKPENCLTPPAFAVAQCQLRPNTSASPAASRRWNPRGCLDVLGDSSLDGVSRADSAALPGASEARRRRRLRGGGPTSGNAIEKKRQPHHAGDGRRSCAPKLYFLDWAPMLVHLRRFQRPAGGRGHFLALAPAWAVEQHPASRSPPSVVERKCCKEALSWRSPPPSRAGRAPGRLRTLRGHPGGPTGAPPGLSTRCSWKNWIGKRA